eukprot:m.66162 g.66162  ORF g.66162 m.66162 type:complete len:99 (+) comp13719_c0_seq2:47-343(+)
MSLLSDLTAEEREELLDLQCPEDSKWTVHDTQRSGDLELLGPNLIRVPPTAASHDRNVLATQDCPTAGRSSFRVTITNANSYRGYVRKDCLCFGNVVL